MSDSVTGVEAPIISIITPSFNQGPYIEETIKSVISQSGEFKLDYLIMDGGSTDQSVGIIKKYAEAVEKGEWDHSCRGVTLRWVSEKDKGQTDAINKGMRMATGKICGYLNSDDLLFPGALDRVARFFRSNPAADFVYGDGDVIDDRGNVLWEWLSRPYRHSVMRSYHFLWNDFSNFIMQQATFWRRGVVDTIGEFDDSFHYAMDVEYWVRAGARGLHLVHLPEKLGKFRMIPGTKSLSDPNVFWMDTMEIGRRYNGAGSMRKYFQYFYYNAILHRNLDTGAVPAVRSKLFDRWNSLPGEEVEILRRRSAEGEERAQMMIAAVAFDAGQVARSVEISGDVLKRHPMAFLWPASWGILLRRGLGADISSRWSALKSRAIEFYREKRYQYRYRRNRP